MREENSKSGIAWPWRPENPREDITLQCVLLFCSHGVALIWLYVSFPGGAGLQSLEQAWRPQGARLHGSASAGQAGGTEQETAMPTRGRQKNSFFCLGFDFPLSFRGESELTTYALYFGAGALQALGFPGSDGVSKYQGTLNDTKN